ncbi:hypothetical protein [Halovivax gelatinilyticus]|uniref:hypothetical protein n=1 Tax=Halovivax gelatinilyticus TaxID=2961597 RepID=UPI0020CA83BA|nr:hypothetical protein [Halovivax gelatinilyticus]
MTTPIPTGRSNVDVRRRRLGGLALAFCVFVLAVGHLFVLRFVSGLTVGIPNWLWVQLGVLCVMFALAWAAVRLWRTNAPGGRR